MGIPATVASSLPFSSNKLPRLPVPDLHHTLAQYIQSVKPLLVEEARHSNIPNASAWVTDELQKRQDWAEDFGKRNALGGILHERLVDTDRKSPNNWLNDNYWTDVVYHSWRVPLPINSNWWVLCIHDPDVPKTVNESRPPKGQFTSWQVRRAAALIWRLLDFKTRLDRQEVCPDASRAGPFDMHQYTRVYGMTRVPHIPTDQLTRPQYPHPSSHITVLVRNQIYTLDVSQNHAGEWKDIEDLESALWAIINETLSDTIEPELPIAILTGTDRDSWAEARENLIALSPGNRNNLSAIEDSLFAVSLDDWTRIHPAPHATSRSSHLIPLGDSAAHTVTLDTSLELDSHILTARAGADGHNRWFDKSLSISIENNARASVQGEHSPCDALIPSIVIDYMLAGRMGQPSHTAEKRGEVGSVTAVNAVTSPPQKRLRWVTDSRINEAIVKAERTVQAVVSDSDGLMLWFDEYGVRWIKKQAKLSPDAYIQLAMQLAYRRMHGTHTATYETASTRLYLHGRTDVIRTFTEDTHAWVEAVISGKADSNELYTKLAKAVETHNANTRAASTGKGIDRHLLGLRLNLRKNESHKLFEDPLYTRSQTWKLSTSGLSAGDRFSGTGFGASEPDGYGINYLAATDIIKFGIESKFSSPVTDTHRFRLAIIQAMRDMRQVCEDALGPEAKL